MSELGIGGDEQEQPGDTIFPGAPHCHPNLIFHQSYAYLLKMCLAPLTRVIVVYFIVVCNFAYCTLSTKTSLL